jgi:predicted nucleic acid-binding Zn ribbon protein
MGKAADWLREERRKTLGDWVAFCIGCGHALRFFDEWADELPKLCPSCGGEMRAACPSCGARFRSAFAVECEECGAGLRPPDLFGSPIRKGGR